MKKIKLLLKTFFAISSFFLFFCQSANAQKPIEVDDEWRFLDGRVECVIQTAARNWMSNSDITANRYSQIDSLALGWHWNSPDMEGGFHYWIIGAVFRSESDANRWWENKGLHHNYFDDSKFDKELDTLIYNDYKKETTVELEKVIIKARGFEYHRVEGTLWWKKGRFIFQVGNISRPTNDSLVSKTLIPLYQNILKYSKTCALFEPITEIVSLEFSYPLTETFITCESEDIWVFPRDSKGKIAQTNDREIEVTILAGEKMLKYYKSHSFRDEGLFINLSDIEPDNNLKIKVSYGDLSLESRTFDLLEGYKAKFTDFPVTALAYEQIKLKGIVERINASKNYVGGVAINILNSQSFDYNRGSDANPKFETQFLIPHPSVFGNEDHLKLQVTPTCTKSESSGHTINIKVYQETETNNNGFYNTQTFGGEDNDVGVSVSFGDGVVYLAGDYEDYVSIDGEPLESQGNDDAFIMQAGALGNLNWVRSFGGEGKETVKKILVEDSGASSLINLNSFTIIAKDKIIEENIPKNWALITYDDEGEIEKIITSKQNLKSNSDDYASDFTLDNKKNAIITGNFEGDIIFDSYAGDNSWTGLNSGGDDMFVAKYDKQRDLLWGFSAGSPKDGESSEGNAVVSDEMGNIYVVGEVDDFIDFGTFQLEEDGVFLLKISPDGIPQWARLLEGNIHVDKMAIDQNNDIVFTGTFLNNIVYEGTIIEEVDDRGEIYIVKIDTTGKLIWFKQFQTFEGESSSSCDPQGIACDKNNTIFVTGHFSGSIIFDDAYRFKAIGNKKDFFVASFDADGNTNWALKGGGEGNDYARGIAVNENDECAIIGSFREQMDLGNAPVTSSGGSDIFFTYASKPTQTAIQTNDLELVPELFQNYPNPLNDKTTIKYTLKQKSDVIINVYSISGIQVFSSIQNNQAVGEYTLEIDARKYQPGIYFYQLKTNNYSTTKKMIVD